jgi:hypothetical protein
MFSREEAFINDFSNGILSLQFYTRGTSFVRPFAVNNSTSYSRLTASAAASAGRRRSSGPSRHQSPQHLNGHVTARAPFPGNAAGLEPRPHAEKFFFCFRCTDTRRTARGREGAPRPAAATDLVVRPSSRNVQTEEFKPSVVNKLRSTACMRRAIIPASGSRKYSPSDSVNSIQLFESNHSVCMQGRGSERASARVEACVSLPQYSIVS